MPHLSDITMLLSVFSGVAAVIVGWRYKGLLWYYAWTSLGMDVLMLALKELDLLRNGLGNLFFLMQFLLVAHYLIRYSQRPALKLPVIAAVYATAIWFVTDTLLKSWRDVNYDSAGVLSGVLILLLLWAFYKVIRDMEVLKIERSPLFIFSAGFLLYVSGSLIIFIARKYMTQNDPQLKEILRIVHHILNILKNAAVAYSLFLYKRARLES